MVSMPVDDFQLTVAYVSKEANLPDLKKALEQTLDRNLPQLLLGDFNFNPKEDNCVSGFLHEAGLSQAITQPTHQEGRTLDHLYLSGELKEKIKFDVQFKYFTDHAALQIKLNV